MDYSNESAVPASAVSRRGDEYNKPMAPVIPASARPFFQEYNFSVLDPDQHASLIIERLLAYGNRAEVRWLFDTYGEAALRAWLGRDGRRLLPRRRYALWCVVLGVSPDTSPRKSVWPH